MNDNVVALVSLCFVILSCFFFLALCYYNLCFHFFNSCCCFCSVFPLSIVATLMVIVLVGLEEFPQLHKKKETYVLGLQ